MAKITEQDRAEILKQYASGRSAREIAKSLHVSHTAISKILNEIKSCQEQGKVATKVAKQNNHELAKQIIDKAMLSVVKDIEKTSPMDRIKIVERLTYQPLSNATDRYQTTKAGKTYINGTLTGFGCRHTTTPYKKGNGPSHIPSDVIERQRAIESRQRELERKIRQYETRALGWRASGKNALTKEEKAMAIKSYRHNHELVKKWQNQYINFCKENNVAYYPSRLKI